MGLGFGDHFIVICHHLAVFEFRGEAEPVDGPPGILVGYKFLAKHVPISLARCGYEIRFGQKNIWGIRFAW